MAKKYAAVIEKADRKLGLLFVKVSAESVDESAFYDFLLNRPADPFDFGKGMVVTGWWFPQEQCGRVAFRPKDAKALETTKATPVTKARPDESTALRRWRTSWQ